MSYKGGREPTKLEDTHVSHLDHGAQTPGAHAVSSPAVAGSHVGSDQINMLGPAAAMLGGVRFR
jgi:hypothetical protein